MVTRGDGGPKENTKSQKMVIQVLYDVAQELSCLL